MGISLYQPLLPKLPPLTKGDSSPLNSRSFRSAFSLSRPIPLSRNFTIHKFNTRVNPFLNPSFGNLRYFQKAKLLSLPRSVDLSPFCSPVEDQGDLGSCTGNAIVGALELLQNKFNLFNSPSSKYVDLSRLYVYYNERVLENSVNEDSGATLSDGIVSLINWGVCTESLWPYNISSFTISPTDECYLEGRSRRIKVYSRVRQDLNTMKSLLSSGYPFVLGIAVYSSMMSARVAKSGVVPYPSYYDYCLGGHAVLVVGYNDVTQTFKLRNSWGPSWGQKGYFTLPYRYLLHPSLSFDMWVVKS